MTVLATNRRYVILEPTTFVIGEHATTDQEAIEAARSELQDAFERRYFLIEWTGSSDLRLVSTLHAKGRIITEG